MYQHFIMKNIRCDRGDLYEAIRFFFSIALSCQTTRFYQMFHSLGFFSSSFSHFFSFHFYLFICTRCLMLHTIFHLKMHKVCFHCDHRLLHWHKNSMKTTTTTIIIIKGRTRKKNMKMCDIDGARFVCGAFSMALFFYFFSSVNSFTSCYVFFFRWPIVVVVVVFLSYVFTFTIYLFCFVM